MNLKRFIRAVALPLCICLFSMLSVPLQASTHDDRARNETIFGKVVDSNDEPVIGASVVVKDVPNISTVTDIDGNFRLDVPAGSTVDFSFLGHKTTTMPSSKLKDVVVVMQDDMMLLDDVVVVGFGTQKKVNMTGAVESVSSEILESRPVQNIAQALQGAVPGLNISQNQGLLDYEPTVNIRGLTTISQGSSGSPLILVDGVEANWNTLNPDDVESISVLKDAS